MTNWYKYKLNVGYTYTVNNNVPFLCNPIGYPGENQKQDFATNIEIIN